jgi:hypothetical protein
MVADPHHIMRIRIQLFTLMRIQIRIFIHIKVMMGIYDLRSKDPPGLVLSLQASIVSVHVPLRLDSFEPL